MESQAKRENRKKERKKGNNGGSQLDCTSSQEYNQHSLHPKRSTSSNVPGSLYPFLVFYYDSDVDDVHFSDTSKEPGKSFYIQCHVHIKKEGNKSSTDQLKMGHPPATSDQFFVVVGLSSIYPVTISKSRQLYPSKLTWVWVLYDVVT